jgi:hypothetical protein
MEYKNIKNYEHYQLFEDGKIYNTKTKKYIKPFKASKSICVKLSDKDLIKTFALSRLVYENYYDIELSNKEIIKFIDDNNKNFCQQKIL